MYLEHNLANVVKEIKVSVNNHISMNVNTPFSIRRENLYDEKGIYLI